MFPRTPWMRTTRERTCCSTLWTYKFCNKAANASEKNPTLEQKWLCNKQTLIRCHEKFNPSVQKCWKCKMQGLQNINCIPLRHTSRFHPFIMVAEICCETRFWRSRNTISFCQGWTIFSFYITIKEILLRKCFEYVHPITRDWFYFKSGLDCQSPK